MTTQIERQRGDTAIEQIGDERREAIPGGGILVGQHDKGECYACVLIRISKSALQHQSVPGGNGHLQWRQVHANPSCRVSRCQSAAEITPSSRRGVRVLRISPRDPSIRRSRSSVIIRENRCSYSSAASLPSFRWLLSFLSSSATRAGVTGLSAPPCWSAAMDPSLRSRE